MKNPKSYVVSEIGDWLINHGYRCRHIFVVDFVHMFISSKISKDDLNEFEREFGHEIHLNGASFDENGQKREFEYFCDHELLVEFRAYVRDWLRNHNFPFDYTIVMDDISIYCSERLSETQIHEFEDEFEVRCRGYSLTCNSNEIIYKFS